MDIVCRRTKFLRCSIVKAADVRTRPTKRWHVIRQQLYPPARPEQREAGLGVEGLQIRASCFSREVVEAAVQRKVRSRGTRFAEVGPSGICRTPVSSGRRVLASRCAFSWFPSSLSGLPWWCVAWSLQGLSGASASV